jgi:N-acyl-D-aspartate/D-glutamate deacylase
MTYDLVIRGGTVVDGTGLAGFRADVAVTGGRIAEVGRVRERGAEEIDADGMVVTPGFVDGHTHMDAQVFWDPLGSCSCWHGVTTVVMGNCGFTLAPARPDRRDLVVANLERAEDISPAAMAAGIEWTWDTFRGYLDAVDRLPKGINYASNIGHSALRTWVMGERAWDGPASEDDLAAMERELGDALDAGAIGFTTSLGSHLTPDGRPVASRLAEWTEIERLVGLLGDKGAGLFELAGTPPGATPEEKRARLRDLAVGTGVPVTFGLFALRNDESWREQLALLDATAAAGGRMFGQSHSRDISNVLSFLTQLPFDRLPEWQAVRALPVEEQRVALADPEVRARLVEAAHHGEYPRGAVGGEARKPNYETLRVVRSALPGRNPTVASVAAERGVDPVEAMIDLALERDLDQFFLQPNVNFDLDAVLEILRHPRTVMTFSDSGAHVSQIMDASIQTVLLAYWVRERQAFTLEEAVRMITSVPATSWGFADRGILREGLVADLNVFDPATITPELPTVRHDLPAGATRLVQKTSGIRATVVGGQVVVADGEHTGALPGRLLRGPLARRRSNA